MHLVLIAHLQFCKYKYASLYHVLPVLYPAASPVEPVVVFEAHAFGARCSVRTRRPLAGLGVHGAVMVRQICGVQPEGVATVGSRGLLTQLEIGGLGIVLGEGASLAVALWWCRRVACN